MKKSKFLKAFFILCLLVNFVFSAECHCKNFIEQFFMARTNNDLTRQLKQMSIDQSNFASHFVNIEMAKGLENELKGVLSSYNKLQSTMQDYEEMLFLTRQLVKELEVSNKLTTIEIREDMLKDF